MTFKACKYNCNTSIQWDTDLGAFRESDGKLHDRKRCESLRTNGNTGSSSGTGSGPQQQQQQQQYQQQPAPPQQTQQTSSVRSDVWLIPKSDWDKVVSHIVNMTIQLEHLSQYYGDLVEHVRALSTVNRREEAKADAELAYDTDREDGKPFEQ